MYCAVRQYTLKSPGEVDKIVALARDGFLPIITKANGFIAYTIALSDQGDLITTSIFQDRSGADESTRLAADWVRDNVASTVEGPPQVSAGEMAVVERREGNPTHGGLRRGKIVPGKKDETFALVRGGLVPLLTSVPGFLTFAAIDTGSDDFVTISSWSSREALQEATAKATSFMQKNAGDLFAGPAERIDGEIKLRHVNEEALSSLR